MVSIGNLTARQAAVSSAHGIGFVVRKIRSMVSKVYNGLRTWGSGNSRSTMQHLSRPSVNKSVLSRASQGSKPKNGSSASADNNNVTQKPGSIPTSERTNTMQIISKIRKDGPAKSGSSPASKAADPVRLLSV
ncbi:MAG: hypothetical protein O3C63_05225 [Cyanobacteria bacterium]|nr:hypothetical protein [Cyanobacteriota bacterium]MDA1020655.1 hypothetical protein [Cyanobacteriota bacterium]